MVVLSPVVGLLAIGGVALAGDAGIVDPWDKTVSGWFYADPQPSPVAPEQVFESIAHDRKSLAPSRAPVPGDHEIVVEPWNPKPTDALPDPWSAGAGTQLRPLPAEPSSPALASVHPRAGDWAYVIREIIDPWRRGPGVVSRDPLIVDPWAGR